MSLQFNPVSGTFDIVTVQQGTQVWITEQQPTNSANGTATVFTTPSSYISGSLVVYLNGLQLLKGGDYTETTTSTFTFSYTPLNGDTILLTYRTS